MDSNSEAGGQRHFGWVLARVLLYVGAIALLVIFAPGEDHVFVYQAF